MNEKTEMMASMIKNLALLLLEQNNELTMEQALSIVFNSETYRKVMDERTHFYYQSPKYVFAFLEEELKKDKSSVCFIAKTNGRFFYFSFFSKSLISVSSWMSAGGAAGAFGSSFFFLLRAFIPFTKRKMANAMMMKSSVVWIKLP